jgi:hypothetical protein
VHDLADSSRSMTSASPNLAEILIRRTDVADVVETGGKE